MITRYGVAHALQADQLKAKARITMYKNNTVPTSNQQLYFYNIIQNNELDKNNVILNFPLNHLSLDIALINEKIDIEYNGGGHDLDVKLRGSTHEQFLQKEIRRNKFIKQQGWKQIFIISPNDIIFNFTEQEYLKILAVAKSYLLNTNHHWVNIYIEKDKFETQVYTKQITNILIV